jgi:OOP family OmpA-OmpF porin
MSKRSPETTMHKKMTKWALLTACVTAAGTASAQFYAGAQGGWATGGPDGGEISNELVNNLGFFSASTSVDKGDGAWRVFGGYQILPWLAVEGAYVDVGKTSFHSTVQPPGTLDVSLTTTAWTLGVAARYEFVPKLFGYGRISAAWTETKSSVSGSGFVEPAGSPKSRRTVPAYAAGIEYLFAPQWAVRVEYEGMSGVSSDELGGKFDTNMFSAGVRYNF